ncbi:hypothetical protein [Sessilibacter sp. MAH2]
MKEKPKTKSEIRAEIEQQISQYISAGGEVKEHAQGESGQFFGVNPFKSMSSSKPPEARTMVNDEIAAIESRKKPIKPPTKKIRRAKKILIKDDFGQPLRWVWEE